MSRYKKLHLFEDNNSSECFSCSVNMYRLCGSKTLTFEMSLETDWQTDSSSTTWLDRDHWLGKNTGTFIYISSTLTIPHNHVHFLLFPNSINNSEHREEDKENSYKPIKHWSYKFIFDLSWAWLNWTNIVDSENAFVQQQSHQNFHISLTIKG